MAAEPRRAETDRIAEARRGDPEALAALYRQYGDDIMGVAFRLTGSRADAEDVLHDVFLGLPEALARYEERGNLRAWLRQVAARVALMRLRAGRRKREVPLETVPELRDEAQAEPETPLAVARALARLPPGMRAVFVLKVVEGYSHAEIGDLLGISVKASEVRLTRALKALRKQLERSR